MKISIGAKIVDGPWGGGNLFAINLSNYLKSNDHQVVYDLNDNDIDLILLMDPRKNSESSAFTHKEISTYLKKVKKDTLVVHRINECDQRKNTKGLNKKYIKINKKIANHTVFVSKWLFDIYRAEGFESTNSSVIMAGANKDIFNSRDSVTYSKNEKIKVVTHHWSNNWNKGFDIYKKLDNLLSEPYWSSKFEFQFIGNTPKNFHFKNTKLTDPKSGLDLGLELKSNHIYLTASINEPSGNHHIEAAQCGLPILYLNSGGMPEYCENFGLSFEYNNFEQKLNEMKSNYFILKENMINYPFSSKKMCEEFLSLFQLMLDSKKNYI